MKALTRSLEKVYKSYLFTVVARDLKRLTEMDLRRQLRKAARNIDFDKDYWLHKAGLTTYRPVRRTIGSGLLFIAGAAIGAVAGLALAPTRGEEFRRQLKSRASTLMSGRSDLGETQAPAQA